MEAFHVSDLFFFWIFILDQKNLTSSVFLLYIILADSKYFSVNRLYFYFSDVAFWINFWLEDFQMWYPEVFVTSWPVKTVG